MILYSIVQISCFKYHHNMHTLTHISSILPILLLLYPLINHNLIYSSSSETLLTPIYTFLSQYRLFQATTTTILPSLSLHHFSLSFQSLLYLSTASPNLEEYNLLKYLLFKNMRGF